MKIKRSLIEICRRIANLGYKQQDVFKDIPLIWCNENAISYLASSNNLIKIDIADGTFFFKECKKHTDFNLYCREAVREFFEYVCQDENSEYVKQIVIEDFEDKHNIRKLRKINEFVENNYHTIIKDYDGWDTGIIGLPLLYEKYSKRDARVIAFMKLHGRQFISYIRNDIYAYNLNDYCKINEYQLFRPRISIATKKLADLLQLSHIIPDCWYVKLQIGNRDIKYGIITRQCSGSCPLDLPERLMKNITPLFQKEMLNLNIFDAICFQRDHKKENYFVTINSFGQVDGVLAFDNDSPMAFFPYPFARFKTSVMCSPIIVRGEVNRPFVDRVFFEVINKVTGRQVMESVRNELSILQMFSLALRYIQVKRAIKNAIVLNDSDWNLDTIDIELNGQYGKTYLKHFLECDEEKLINKIMNVD